MMDNNINSINEIKAIYQELPQELKDAITASDWNSRVKLVASKNNLLLDQIASLQNEVLFVMLGIERSADFVSNISNELNIDRKTAIAITEDVNNLVLEPIKIYLRQQEDLVEEMAEKDRPTPLPQDYSMIEKVGGFTIEKNEVPSGSIGSNSNAFDPNVTPKDKARILNDIEYPAASKETIVDQKGNKSYENTHTEPLVDQLLSGATAVVEKKVTIEAPINLPIEGAIGSSRPRVTTNAATATMNATTPAMPAPIKPSKLPELPPKPKGPDMYREPMK